jgi:hypothetical protein
MTVVQQLVMARSTVGMHHPTASSVERVLSMGGQGAQAVARPIGSDVRNADSRPLRQPGRGDEAASCRPLAGHGSHQRYTVLVAHVQVAAMVQVRCDTVLPAHRHVHSLGGKSVHD